MHKPRERLGKSSLKNNTIYVSKSSMYILHTGEYLPPRMV